MCHFFFLRLYVAYSVNHFGFSRKTTTAVLMAYTVVAVVKKFFKKMKIRSYKPSKLVEKFDLNFGSTAKYVQIYNSAKRVF